MNERHRYVTYHALHREMRNMRRVVHLNKERSKRMKKRALLQSASMALALVLLSGVFLAGVQGQAQALASHPPDALLKQGNKILQDGRLISYCWIDGCADGVSRYPSAVLIEPGTRLHIRLSENRRPERFSLTSSRSPDGQSRRIDTTIRRVERDGKTVAWDAYFRLERPDRHYYLGAFGVWKNLSGTVRGDAYWQFHLKTGS
jgi:hypothetical protein